MKQILSLSLFFITMTVNAGSVVTPSSLAGVKIVTANEAKAIQDKGGLIVDVRKKLEYVEGHIKGAKALPYKEKSAKDAGYDMGKDKFKIEKISDYKNKDVVFQCNGDTCWKSYKAAKWAVTKGGFTKVHWFRGGLPEWKSAGLPTE